jgi:hypothetical protein
MIPSINHNIVRWDYCIPKFGWSTECKGKPVEYFRIKEEGVVRVSKEEWQKESEKFVQAYMVAYQEGPINPPPAPPPHRSELHPSEYRQG